MDWYRLLPRYWFQNDPTDYGWDAALNAALDRFAPEPKYMTAKVGPFTVWDGNYPYAYGHRYDDRSGGKISGPPKVGTRKRLRAAIRASGKNNHMRELGL